MTPDVLDADFTNKGKRMFAKMFKSTKHKDILVYLVPDENNEPVLVVMFGEINVINDESCVYDVRRTAIGLCLPKGLEEFEEIDKTQLVNAMWTAAVDELNEMGLEKAEEIADATNERLAAKEQG